MKIKSLILQFQPTIRLRIHLKTSESKYIALQKFKNKYLTYYHLNFSDEPLKQEQSW